MAGLGICGLLLVSLLWSGGEDEGVPDGLQRGTGDGGPSIEAVAPELPALPRSPVDPGARAPIETPATSEPASATKPESPAPPSESVRQLVFCDGVPATNLEFKLPGQYGQRSLPTSTDDAGRVADWPKGLTSPWLRLTGTVLGSESGAGTHTTSEFGAVRLGLRRLLIETYTPPGIGSRRVKLTASMTALDSDQLHRSVTSVGGDSGPAAFFAPCDRPFTVEASIERAGPLDADYFGTLHVPAEARSDVVFPLALAATHRGKIQVVDPNGTLGEVSYTLTCTEPHGRYRKKGLIVGETYEAPPGEYTVRLDVDALAKRNSDQRLAEPLLNCSVSSGLHTRVPLHFEPAARIRVRAAPGAYASRGKGTVIDLQPGRRFHVQLLRDGTSLIPTRWFRGEVPFPVSCEAGSGPYDSSALSPGVVHVVFRLGQAIVGEPVRVSLGAGEVVEVVMPTQ